MARLVFPHVTFNKHLGNAEITEVFKIEIKKTNSIFQYEIHTDYPNGRFNWFIYTSDFIKELAKLDGFKSAEDMFIYFDNTYDLSQSKPFWVYRWKYLS